MAGRLFFAYNVPIVRYVRCQGCAAQNKSSDLRCYSCQKPLKEAVVSLDADTPVDPAQAPPSLVGMYQIVAQDGVITMRAKQIDRIVTGLLLGLLGCFWLSAFILIPTSGGTLFAGLVGLITILCGLKIAITKVTVTLARGKLALTQQSPFGTSVEDHSQSSLVPWGGAGRIGKLYLVKRGQSIGPFTPKIAGYVDSDDSRLTQAWLAAVTGLENLQGNTAGRRLGG